MKIPFHIGKSPAKKREAANNSGVILALVVMVLVIVSILGVGLLSQSAMNAIDVVKNIKSTQAFWIADGGLEKAISYLSKYKTMPANPFNGTLGNGVYNVTITQPDFTLSKWIIESVGSVNIITRTIGVEFRVMSNGNDVKDAMMLSGQLTQRGNAVIDGNVVQNTIPNFNGVFGETKEEMQDNATYEYTNPPNNKMPVEKITWVNNDFKITENGWVGSGIMIVDGDLTITGGQFNGVIWVIGKLTISGNPVIKGSIFVESAVTVDTTVTGTARISFDPNAIDDAFGNLGTSSVSSWQEL